MTMTKRSFATFILVLLAQYNGANAFVQVKNMMHIPSSLQLSNPNEVESSERRFFFTVATAATAVGVSSLVLPQNAFAEGTREFVQEYDDFIKSPDGSSYRVVKEGKGQDIKVGDRVVFDWSGYTIGYFGRPFEAKGGPQGGAFDKEIDYFRTVIGSGKLVKGLDAGLTQMKPGAIHQVVVPFGPLSYPADDASHDRVGPKPTTFSGQRALNFVLENPRVDRTLLFNVKIIRVDKPDGKGGFIRG